MPPQNTASASVASAKQKQKQPLSVPPKEQSAIQPEKHIPSSFIRKEDAEPDVVATRVECISSVQDLTDLAKAGALVGDIKELHMQAVDLSDPANASQFDLKFCYAIAKCKGVQVLSLTYGQMESHLAHRLATGVSQHATLRRLCLRGNSIKSSGVALMAQQLKGNTTLKVLDLDENGIGPSFPTELLTALPKLQKLNLYGNEIRTFPHELLHTPHTNLEDLDLRANGMQEDALAALAVPTRWLLDGQRDEATMKLLRVRRQVRLY